METRDEVILDHLGRYTISIKRVIDEYCLGGGSSQKSIARLTRANLVQAIDEGLVGNFRYFQLTQKGAKSRGIPVNRTRGKDAKGLASDLAALWFSCMGPVPRKRLTAEELATLFGTAPKGNNVIYVAQSDGDDSTVFRLFIPGEDTLLKAAISNMKKSAFDAASDERLLPWIERGTFRFAVLVQNENRREEAARLIRKEEFPDLRIHLEVVPSPTNLKEFITPEAA